MEVRAQPVSPVALPPPDEERRGKGRSETGSAAHTRSLLVGRGARGERREGAASPPLLAAKQESQGPNPPPQIQKRSPPHISPEQPPAQPRTLAAPTEGRSPVAFASPAVPAGRRVQEAPGRELSGPSHFRGARRV